MKRQYDEDLTRESLEGLLTFLGVAGDPGEEYQRLRQRLVKVLEIRTTEHRIRATPEDLADEAIYRVARKLQQGLEIRASDPYHYFSGVARLVVKEAVRSAAKETDLIEETEAAAPEPDVEVAETEDQRFCLDQCLEQLSREDRKLILQFYQVDRGRPRIAHRKRLARKLGVTPNALRIRAHRLRRHHLEPCVSECLAHAREN